MEGMLVNNRARAIYKVAFQANRKCMILPFAMGPNVAGVITSATVTGIYISGIGFIN